MINNYDITELENTIAGILKTNAVTANVYGNRPKSKTTSNDFAVVAVHGELNDNAAYATCRLYVSLFAKDNAGEKNSAKLGVMYSKLIACMPAETSRFLIDTTPHIIGDSADDYDFHARTVNFSITIKIQ